MRATPPHDSGADGAPGVPAPADFTAAVPEAAAARMRQGEVWTVGDRSDLRYRVLVLTGDNYNDRANAAPLCAPIVRLRGAEDLPPHAVPLAEQDPITGIVVLNRLRRLPAHAGAERIGMITGSSMVRLHAALRALFEL
ncbi:hypothetical protein GCM10010124_35640 [Pilimelia terevasa]|uniref:mRNA interferase MazF n=1 Tax=Pilimelia terevasa TaxID=53372 RepID=A0A8J3BQ87_9ACTN|nr:type II toxin-antitoxin system PemK/MazF family toxin [Pilimelia terevasa]GGK39854.1 hypothetical protein GCM10010124_35640 [Pilimelia terevasa]